MTAREVLDGIKGRLAAATPGPWEWDEEGFMGCGQVYTMHPDVLGGNIAAPSGDLYPRSGYSPKDDMQFIAAAPVDVARLTRAVEAVLAVHEPVDAVMNPGRHERIVKVCTGCGTDDGNWQRWPCPTVAGVEAALNPKEGR